jgi:hypothetical protein
VDYIYSSFVEKRPFVLVPVRFEIIHSKNIQIWQIANGAGNTFPTEKGTEAAHDGTDGTIVQRNAAWKVKTI